MSEAIRSIPSGLQIGIAMFALVVLFLSTSVSSSLEPSAHDQMIRSTCSKLDSKRELCADALHTRLTLLAQSGIRKSIDPDVKSVLEHIMRLKPEIEFLCKVRRSRIIDCIKTGAMLAHLKPKMISKAVADLNKIAAKYKLDKTVAFKCEDGKWGDVSMSEKELFTGPSLSANATVEMGKKCESLRSGSGSSGAPAAPALSGYSGYTGIDESPGYCGLRFQTSTSTSAFLQKAAALANEMQKTCVGTLMDTLIEGGNGSEDATSGTEDTSETNGGEEEASESEEEASETEEGETKPSAKVVITNLGNGKEKVEEFDADGNLVESYERDRTSTFDKVEIEYYDDGEQIVARRNDGSGAAKQTDADGDPGSYYRIDWDQDGNTSESYRRKNNGGYDIVWNQPFDCVDESCSNCKDFMQFHPKIIASCSGAAGTSTNLCEAFGATANCCSNPKTLRVDPRIVLPNVSGDLVCSDTGPDVQKTRCEFVCQFADSGCEAACKKTAMRSLEFNFLDQICLQAEADWCFSNKQDFGIGSGPPPGGISPTPYSVSDFFLFPGTNE